MITTIDDFNKQRLEHAEQHRHPIFLLLPNVEAKNNSPTFDSKVYVDASVSIGSGNNQKRYYFNFGDTPDKYEQAKQIAKRIDEAVDAVIFQMGGTPKYKPCKACGE